MKRYTKYLPILIAIFLWIISCYFSHENGYKEGKEEGFRNGKSAEKEYIFDRCMKYFGQTGYPADGYCKLFVGDIKARDE